LIPTQAIHRENTTVFTTLGSEAQVITATLDLLLRARQPVNRLLVFHTDPALAPIAASLQRLQEDLSTHPYPAIQVFFHLLQDGETARPLSDFDDRRSAEVFFAAFYRTLREAKQAGQRVHVCPAGGRKTMAMYAMAAAQLLFDEDDHFWQLFSSGDFLQSKRMHPAPADDAQLVEVPVIHWGLLSPVMSMLRNEEDPFAAIEQIRALRLRQKWQLAEAFIQQELTPAQRAVVACLVTDGLSDQQIAERLVLSPRTIERHLGDAYSRATQFFGFSERVTRAQLIALLQIYYSMQLGETPHDN